MLKKPKDCLPCILGDDVYKTGGFSVPEGTCKNGVLIVGESLGQNEKYDGLPFRPFAEAGAALQTAITRLGLNRADFAFYNLIQCQPPFNILNGASYEEEAVSYCGKTHLEPLVKKLKPKVILAMGGLPLMHLCPEIYELRKKAKEDKNKELIKKLSIASLRGYVFKSKFENIPIVGSLHPSYIRRTQMVYLSVLIRDIFFALQVARGNIEEFKTFYNESPTLDDIENYYNFLKKNPSIPVSYDIETPYTLLEVDESELDYKNIEVRDILSTQFSSQEKAGIFINWRDETKPLIEKILSLPNPKIGWNNWQFDQVNLEYHLGKGSIKGLSIDLMWMWKHYNPDFGTGKDAPIGRSLQFVTNFYAPNFPAWKHLSEENPTYYGCLDTDAVLRIYNGLKRELESKRLNKDSKSLYEGFIDDLVNLRPILNNITERGFPVDIAERNKFKKMVKKEITETYFQLQKLYPFSLRRTDPVQGFKTIPKEVVSITEKFYNNLDIENGNGFCFIDKKDFLLKQIIERETRTKEGMSGLVVKEFKLKEGVFNRYCRIEEFKPNSSQQVLNYIKLKGHKVPTKRNKGEGEKETTEKDQLFLLYEETGDEFYKLSSYIRELKKLYGTYCGESKKTKKKKEQWIPAEDGRIHASFSFMPKTGQLSSLIHNAPARGTRFSSKGYVELARQFRRTIRAKDKHLLVSLDWSSFHALTLGFEAEDETYIRLVRNDVHSYLASYILLDELPDKLTKLKKTGKKEDFLEIEKSEEGLFHLKDLEDWLGFSDEELNKKLKWIKNNFGFTRNSQAKPAILGIGFAMGIKKFYKLNRYSFQNISQPQRIHGIMKKKFPKLFKWHEYITDLADRQMFLLTRYGYIRRFHNVYDYRLLKFKRPAKLGEVLYQDKQGRWWSKNRGTQFNEAVAYPPANDAFGKKKEAMRDAWEREYIQKYGLVNEIHDDLTFECPENLVGDCVKDMTEIMESPARYLKNSVAPNGLICRVEAKVGKNWDKFNDDPTKGTINLDGMKDFKV